MTSASSRAEKSATPPPLPKAKQGAKSRDSQPPPLPNAGENGGDNRFLFATSIGKPLLGTEICLDVYLRNGFRVLGVPAHASHEVVARETGRLRSLAKLTPAAITRGSVRTGYEQHVSSDSALDAAAKLKDPRFRVVCEVFWPHLPDDVFARVRQTRSLDDAELQAALATTAQRTNGREGALAKHALAVLYHNLALRDEVAFLDGAAEWRDDFWRMALSHWAETVANDHFWQYMEERVRTHDDPRIQSEDLREVRRLLPLVILEFNGVMARLHVGANPAICNRHLALLCDSSFPVEDVTSALSGTISAIASKKLRPLVQRAEAELPKNAKKLKWQEFKKKSDPLLREAEALVSFLTRDLKLGEEIMQYAHFDGFCGAVLDGLNKGIDYDHERERAILFSMVTTEALLEMPVSADVRRRLEAAMRQDRQILYKEFELPDGTDASACWFLPGETASPESAILLPVYKITRLTGAQIQWSSRKVLVPRSSLAEDIHKGRQPKSLAEARQNSPAAASLRDQIEQEKARCASAVESLGQKQKGVAREIAKKHNAEYERLSGALEREEQAVAPAVAAIEGEHAQATAQRKAAYQSALSEIEARLSPQIGEAEQRLTAVKGACRGWRRFAKVGLPSSAVCAAIGGGAAYYMDFAFLLPRSLVGAPGLALGAGVGAALGLVVGHVARHIPVGRQSRAVQRLKDDMGRERAKAKKAYEKDIHAADDAAKKQVAKASAKVTALREDKQKFEASVKAEVKAEEDKVQAEIGAVKTKSEKAVKSLEAKLLGLFKPKDESAARDFPAYKKAKSAGFKDGEKPSDSEAQSLMNRELEKFMASLDPMEKMMLQLALQANPNNAAQVLGNFIASKQR